MNIITDEMTGSKVPAGAGLPKPKQRSYPLDTDKYLHKLMDEIDKETQRDCYLRANRWNRNYFYFLGGLAHAQGYSLRGVWNHIPSLKGLYTSNNFAEKQMTLMSVLTRSDPRYRVTATAGSGETPEKEQMEMETGQETEDAKRTGAMIAQRITDFDLRQKQPPSVRLAKWFYRLNFGTSFGFINYDKNAGAEVQVPTLNRQQFNEPGMSYCGSCDSTFQAQEGTPCTKCGSDQVEHFAGQSFEDDILGDSSSSVRVGDTRLWVPSPWEIGLPPNARLNVDNGELNWDYVAWYQLTRKRRIAYLFDTADDFTDELEIPFMVRQQERLQREYVGAPYSIPKEFAVARRYWLRPWMYHDGVAPKDITLADGTQITAGTRYIDVCPDGMYVGRAGRNIFDLDHGNIDTHWSQSHYTYNPLSPWGKGIEDAADLQTIINALYQIAVEHGKRDSVGTTIINQNAGLDTNAFMGGNVIPAELEVGQPIQNIATRLDGNPLSASLFTTLEMARNDQTAVSGASSVLAGTNEQLPETATATKLLVQRATSILTPMLLMDVEQTSRIVKQNLLLKQKFQTAETFMSFTDEGEHEEGRAFSAADIPKDFAVSVIDGSWLPTDSIDVQAELEQAMTLGQLPGGIWNPEIPTEVKQAALNVFTTLPRSLNKNQGDESNAHTRILAIKKGLQVIQKMGLPEEELPMAVERVLQMPSAQTRPQVDNFPVHIDVVQTYCKALMNDPTEEIDFLLIGALEKYIELCKEGITTQETEKSAMQVAAQTPMAMAEQAMAAMDAQNQPPEGPEPPPPVDPNVVIKAESEQAKAELDAKEAAENRKEADKDRKHESEGRKHEAAGRTHELKKSAADLKLQKAKPKPSPKK